MNIKYLSIYIFILSLALFTSCKKEEVAPQIEEKGSFSVEFENQVNGTPLILNTQSYTNANGDSFTVSVFKYYVSNLELTRTDGSVYRLPESYILVDAANPSTLINTLSTVPVGDYTKLSFIIGIDKERNVAGAQTGALDPALGMFWTWNSGYIFLKMEGASPQSTAVNHSLTFHIGGFAEPNNTIKTFSVDLNPANPLRIRTDKNPQLHFKVNVAALFSGKQNISFANLNFTMGGANSVLVAENYVSGLFKLDHIHN
ncbi:MAG: MbnP family protein [Bacteroidota bacterium]